MFAAGKTAAVSGAGPDDKFNYVTMLLHGDGTNGAQNNTFVDGSTNNYSITRGGNVGQGSFSPYGSNWSFNNPDSIGGFSVPTSTALDLGTGDFTIEAWVNTSKLPTTNAFQTSSGGYQNIFGTGPDSNPIGTSMYIGVTNLKFEITTDGGGPIDVAHNMVAGVWYHIAVSRSGTTFRAFINGALVQTATSVASANNGYGWGIMRSERIGGYDGAWWFGYVSNFRVVKGTAVYTSAFTPSTTPLTAISGTSLLTCQSNRFIDTSSTAATITVAGSTNVQRFNPFGTATAYTTSAIGGSAYFDVTGDYLSSVNTPANFGSNNFTAEGWYWFNSNTSGYAPVMSNAGSADQQGWIIILESNNTLTALASSGSSWAYNITTSYIPPINVWTHIAYVRNGSTLTLYANGVSIGTASISTNSIGAGSTAFYAGYYPFFPGGARSLNGLISNLRLVNGTAVYTSAFTPPTSQLTAITNTSLLLSTTNGAIIDNAMMNSLKTVGNAQISTSVVKFGTGSMYFDGTGDYIKAPSNFNLLSITPFTVEFWFNTTATTQNTCFVSNESSGGGGGFAILLNSASSNGIIQVYNGASGLINQTSTSYRDGSWHHLALVRDSSGSRLYLDGTQAGSTTSSQATTSFDATTPQPWAIGTSLPFSGRDYVGYIDELRVSKYARYTGSSFTPPTQAFPNTGPI